jgi:hypothetical protein
MSQLNFIFFSTLVAILIWMSSPSARGNDAVKDNPLVEYEARYTVNWRGLYAGESVHKLQRRADGQYHFETRTAPHMAFLPFKYRESSDFTYQAGKIKPQHYYYNIQEGKKRRVGNVSFNWEQNKLFNNELKERWEIAIPEDVQDKLTHTLSLRQALKTGQAIPTFIVAEEDKLKDYTFTILGTERMQTKLGIMDTIKVEHISKRGNLTTLWLAKSLDYAPVKMMQKRQGKVVAGGEILSFTPKTS